MQAEIQTEVWAPDAAARGASRKAVPTMRAYGDQWLESRKTRGRELRPTTRQQYRMLLDTYICPTFGDERLDRITADDVTEWYDALAPGKETFRRRPTACCVPASARLPRSDRSRLSRRTRPHPRRGQREARASGPARHARRARDDYRGATRPLPTDGAPRPGVRGGSASWPSCVAATSTCATTGSTSAARSSEPASSSSAHPSPTQGCATSRSRRT